MRDFPPAVHAFHTLPGERATAAPDLTSPGRFLLWQMRQRPEVVAAATAVGVLWQLPLMVGPWLVGRAVDQGILPGSAPATIFWAGLLLAVTLVGAAFGIAMHTL